MSRQTTSDHYAGAARALNGGDVPEEFLLRLDPPVKLSLVAAWFSGLDERAKLHFLVETARAQPLSEQIKLLEALRTGVPADRGGSARDNMPIVDPWFQRVLSASTEELIAMRRAHGLPAQQWGDRAAQERCPCSSCRSGGARCLLRCSTWVSLRSYAAAGWCIRGSGHDDAGTPCRGPERCLSQAGNRRCVKSKGHVNTADNQHVFEVGWCNEDAAICVLPVHNFQVRHRPASMPWELWVRHMASRP